MRICLPLLACGLLITSPTATDAQAPPGARPRSPGARVNPTASIEIGLQPTLEVALDAQPAAPAAFDATSAYLPLKGGRLVAIDLQSGRVRWTSELATAWAPSVDAGLVVVAGDELLTALDPATGRTLWRVPMAGGFSAPPIAAGGWVIGAPASGDVISIRATDGQVLWTRSLGSPVRVRPALNADRRVRVARRRPGGGARPDLGRAAMGTQPRRQARRIAGARGPIVRRRRRQVLLLAQDDNGGERWKRRIGGRPAGPAAVDAKRVYYVALDNILYALDRQQRRPEMAPAVADAPFRRPARGGRCRCRRRRRGRGPRLPGADRRRGRQVRVAGRSGLGAATRARRRAGVDRSRDGDTRRASS